MPEAEINVTTQGVIKYLPSDPQPSAATVTAQTAAIRAALIFAQKGNGTNVVGKGGGAYFPAGVYWVNDNIFQAIRPFAGAPNTANVTIRGDGPRATIIKLADNIPAASNGVFYVKVATQIGYESHGFTLKDLSLNGNGKTGPWLHLEHSLNIRLDRVEITATPGITIRGRRWWESYLHDVHISQSGAANLPSILMDSTTGSLPAGCRSVCFEAFRFENFSWTQCLIRESKWLLMLGCTWASSTTASAVPNIQLESAFGVGFTNCRSWRSMGDQLMIKKDGASFASCSALPVSSSWENSPGWGLRLEDSTIDSVATANSYTNSAGTNGNTLGTLTPLPPTLSATNKFQSNSGFNDVPNLILGSTSVNYSRNSAAIALASGATVGNEMEATSWNGATLTIALTVLGGTGTFLEIGGPFTISGTNVNLSGTTIGTITKDGIGPNDLQILLNASATDTIVQDLVRAISFRTTAAVAVGVRTAAFTLKNSTSNASSMTINVT